MKYLYIHLGIMMQRKPRFVYKEICRQFEIIPNPTPLRLPFGSAMAWPATVLLLAACRLLLSQAQSFPPLIVHNKVDPSLFAPVRRFYRNMA